MIEWLFFSYVCFVALSFACLPLCLVGFLGGSIAWFGLLLGCSVGGLVIFVSL